MKKVALHNLGCKVNTYETDAMRQSFMEHGYEIVPFEKGADIYIINTCTVTNIADRKSRQMLHKAKKMNPEAIVVAAGCYVQAAGEEILKDEAIDLVIGNNNKSRVVEIVEKYIDDRNNNFVINDLLHESEYEDMNMTTVTEHTRAFIKIQDGCNQFCTYCIIPYARGRIRSRELSDIQREIGELANAGYKEIVLTGIHLSSYGKDMKDKGISLIDAIKAVADIEGVERVRLGSLEPMIISDEFLSQLKEIKEFCPHFHLSLQSGCETTLKRMNRHYTPDEYYDRCVLIRDYFPKAAITTDVIVGFPGETEEEFETTYKFLEDICFYEMHVFKYSKRQGTVAAARKDQVDDRLKTERSNRLLEMEQMQSSQYRKSYIGASVEALMEEEKVIKGQKYQVGYTKTYVKVAVPIEEVLSNQIIEGKAVELLDNEYLVLER